ncbi:Uncharacterized protein conserved in bacteria [Streptococcus pneumoniae]|nr:Uncharacterized protein conserved in bacteria [Streptococcus pneumoniae]
MFEIFKSYQFNQEKAHDYGFIENSEVWTYSCQILQGDFVMTVSITADNVNFQVFDQETGDLYPHVHMESMRRSFVGNVREACLEILYQIRKACFDVFKASAIAYINANTFVQKENAGEMGRSVSYHDMPSV